LAKKQRDRTHGTITYLNVEQGQRFLNVHGEILVPGNSGAAAPNPEKVGKGPQTKQSKSNDERAFTS